MKWMNREIPAHESENQQIGDEIEKIHNASPDKGYRRIRDELERYHGIKANDKRVLRICRKRGINISARSFSALSSLFSARSRLLRC